MPKVRAFTASPERGQFVQLTLVIDRATYEVLVADARDAGVSVERFTARHLAKCAAAALEPPKIGAGTRTGTPQHRIKFP
jgi:hypothetical protein